MSVLRLSIQESLWLDRNTMPYVSSLLLHQPRPPNTSRHLCAQLLGWLHLGVTFLSPCHLQDGLPTLTAHHLLRAKARSSLCLPHQSDHALVGTGGGKLRLSLSGAVTLRSSLQDLGEQRAFQAWLTQPDVLAL